ncbi:GLPGLI family protein [uncultured Aquimarina sp.]|uniref:GLPGLI family protein n=1 Tax=uncultured Aquimarina sp. TaxID=575652 RepID=UPI00261E8EB1|nr:GLPGLI family protein [uncultured Aquimarina sp.]
MKIKLLCIVFLISFSGKSQEMTVHYKEKRKSIYEWVNSFVSEKRLTKEEKEFINEKAENYRKKFSIYEYISVLKIDGSKSIHYSEEEISDIDINNDISYGENGKVFTVRQTWRRDKPITTYMDLDANKKVSTDFISDKNYIISESLVPMNWKIMEETKVINGYTCTKAILINTNEKYESQDQKIVVWYTKDIVSTVGPLGYWGLPGLIIMIVEDRATIVMDSISYTLDGFEVKPPTEGKKVTREDLPSRGFMSID